MRVVDNQTLDQIYFSERVDGVFLPIVYDTVYSKFLGRRECQLNLLFFIFIPYGNDDVEVVVEEIFVQDKLQLILGSFLDTEVYKFACAMYDTQLFRFKREISFFAI